jgi:hypothetical protein
MAKTGFQLESYCIFAYAKSINVNSCIDEDERNLKFCSKHIQAFGA